MSYPGAPLAENRRWAPANAAKDTTNGRGGDERAWEASGPGLGAGTGTGRGRGRGRGQGPGGERAAGGSSGAGARAWGSFSLPGEKDVPRVWVSDRQPMQGETVTVCVTSPPPRTPWGHLHNLMRCRFGGGLVHMRIEEGGGGGDGGGGGGGRGGGGAEGVKAEGAGVLAGRRVKPIRLFRDGSDGWCGYVPTTPLDEPGPRTLTVWTDE